MSKLSLTAQTIKGLKRPASGRVEYFDADTRGLCLRITGVYDRYSYDREKKKALDQWDRRLEAILTKQTAPKKVVRFGR